MMLFQSLVITCMLFGASLVDGQRYPITGVPVSGTPVPFRKNINALQSAGGAQWDLYIRALVELYKVDANNRLSYFQIAGIHGKPYIEWNSAGPKRVGTDDWQGYCPHGEDIFLPWHRPYLMAFEQRLVEVAKTLANAYPTAYRAQYQKAAAELRAPYWDWASSQAVPPATVPTKMKVKIPDGNNLKTVDVDNPLYTYKFPQSALNGQFGTFDEPRNRARIFRCTSPDSYPGSANNLLSQQPYKQWVYDAFTYTTTFREFASTSSSGISLEQIHNNIHWDGACGGQFLDADFAAFDPLFMLHHCNVDRLWTYWQFIRPSEAMFKGSYWGSSRFDTPEGTTISASSPLSPFFQSSGSKHTSNSVKSIRGFGYTYESLEYWAKSDAQLKTDATALINRLYATQATGPVRFRRRQTDGDQKVRYFVQVQVDLEQLERPCSITIFVKDTNIGRLIVLKQPQTGIFNGELALDKAAAAAPVSAAKAETKDTVSTLLSDLRVQITKHDGTNIPVEGISSLKLSLVNTTVVLPASDKELPKYEDGDVRAAPKKQKPPLRLAEEPAENPTD